jgi:hypothetical protein
VNKQTVPMSTVMAAADVTSQPWRKISLASFGGTFITGGQPGRQGLCIPEDEEVREDRIFVTENDPLRPYSDEEFEALSADYGAEERPELAKLIIANTFGQTQILEAAGVVAEHPELILSLYHAGIHASGVEDRREKAAARRKIFELIQMIVSAMIDRYGVPEVNELFGQRDEDYKTILTRLASFARKEKAAKHGYGHWTAVRILTALGHRNIYASYLG